MTLETNALMGFGGAGQGKGSGSLAAMIKELQGLNIDLLAGVGAGASNALAAIRPEDTIVKALNNAAGVLTDVTSTTSIVSLTATGTVTLVAVGAGETVTVNGRLYTAVAGAAADYTQFSVVGDDTADAAALAAAINAQEGSYGASVAATSATNVVTVTAAVEGVAGNSITLAKVGAGVTVSGATLASGAASGAIKVTGATNQVILFWFNKK